jgi:hypothetical protein
MRRGTKTRESDPLRTLSWPGSDPTAGWKLWVKQKAKASAPLRRVLRHQTVARLEKEETISETASARFGKRLEALTDIELLQLCIALQVFR